MYERRKSGKCEKSEYWKFLKEHRDDLLFFYFIFSKNFGLTDLIPPPLSEFLSRNSVYKFWTTFSKNRLGFASVLGRIWVLVPKIEDMTRKPIRAETRETGCRKFRRFGEGRSPLLPLAEIATPQAKFWRNRRSNPAK